MAERPAKKQFVCWCGREYIRKEHLQRHKATHDRPSFTCPSCDRSFTRLDLLRRHSKIHGAVVPDSRKEPACDACHASKIRCDGGGRCSLCRKRDIECTYQRASVARGAVDANPDVVFDLSGGTFSASNPPPRPSSAAAAAATVPSVEVTSTAGPYSAAAAAAAAAAADDAWNVSSRSVSSISSSGGGGGVGSHSGASPPLLSSHVPATAAAGVHANQSPAEASWNERTKAGTRVIANAMGILHDGGESDALSSPSPSMKEWLGDCFRSYFGEFHESWPVLHAPSFDDHDDVGEHVPLAATVAIIGAWRNVTDPLAVQMIFTIHQILMQYLFAQMTRFTFDSSQPWPLEMYQASLLNAIFALEIGKWSLVPRGRMLHVALCTILRQTQMLDSERAIQHQRTHYPSTYLPWVFSKHEAWKRLATSAVKLDRYIAILYNQPAFLYNEELNLQLNSSFAAWNAHGLHEFFPRIQREQPRRQEYRVWQLMSMTDANVPFRLLAEDMELVLLGVANDVWAYRRQLAAGAAGLASQQQRMGITARLELCKHQLHRMHALQHCPKTNAGGGGPAGLQTVLAPYYGREEEDTSPRLLTAAMRRFSRAAANAAMLHDLLALHVCADVPQLTDIASGAYDDNDLYAETLLQKQVRAAEWALSADGRAAAIRAVLMLRLYEENDNSNSTGSPDSSSSSSSGGGGGSGGSSNNSNKCLDPVVPIGLLAAAVVARAWAERVIQGCVCAASLPTLELGGGGLQGLADDDGPAFASWKATGGRLQYNGMALCRCNLGSWRERFARGLPEGGGWRQRLDKNWPAW